MPKKRKSQDGDGRKSHVILNTIIILVVILLWLGIFAIFIKLDIGGLGAMLRPALGDIPIINMVLPEQSEAEIAEEKGYPYTNLADAIARIKELEAQLADSKGSSDSSAKTIADLQAEVDRLKVFEDNQKEFEQRVQDFDEKVVFAEEAPGLEEYQQYYEQINPDNAAQIYEKVVKQLQFEESIKTKAEMFRKMKPEDAAKILEEMTADTESVAKILQCMDSKYSSLILAKMDRTNAAKVTKKMLDLDEQKLSELQ